MSGGESMERVIDLGAIRHNVRVMRRLVPEPAALLAVVKADAYGHGAAQVARASLEAGASALAVARPEEGTSLRAEGIGAPVLVLGNAMPETAREAVAGGLISTVSEPGQVAFLERAALACGQEALFHLKLDTGMGRIGARSPAEIAAVLRALEQAPHVHLTGAYTHFADADGDDPAYTREQLRRFREWTGLLPWGITRHCANSAAILRLMPEAAFDMVRMGISLYGAPPVPTQEEFRPAMRWTAVVTHVKEIAPGECVSYGCVFRAERPTRVATVACGYGDGYHRAATGKAQVLLHGRRVPVIGRICMDQMMIDVTEEPPVRPGDRVTLLGRDGAEVITADELALWAGTISYEVLLAATGRVDREWVDEDAL